MSEPRPPQLRMLLSPLGEVAPVRLPEGYGVRTFTEGDEQAWIDVLNSTEALGAWDLDRAQRVMLGPVRVVREGVHFITHDGIAVATSCLTHHDDLEAAELGWVATMPAHQGQGLGRQVCLATLDFIRRRGYPAVILFTDDHRLAAVRTYLGLGFRPLMTHDSHPGRWGEVLRLVHWPE